MTNFPFKATVDGSAFLLKLFEQIEAVTLEQIAAAEPEDRGRRSDIIIGEFDGPEIRMLTLAEMKNIKIPIGGSYMTISPPISQALVCLATASFFARNSSLEGDYSGVNVLAGWKISGVSIRAALPDRAPESFVEEVKQAFRDKAKE